MATLKAQAPDGKTLSIDVPDGTDPNHYAALVDDVMSHYTSSDSASTGSQWSDLPGNALQGLKEAPQTAQGLGAMAAAGTDLTSPTALARSAGQALTGTPIADTPTGQAFGQVKAGLGNTLNTLKGLPDVAQHPLESAKNELIQHPISSAAAIASLPFGGAGMGEDAAATAGKYATRFGEDQAIKTMGARSGQVGNLGIPESRAIAHTMVDRGIIKPFRGPIGLEDTIKGLSDTTGANIGAARDMADARAAAAGEAAPSAQNLTDLANQKLSPSYQSGHMSGRAGTFNKALESLANPVINEKGEMTGPSAGTFSGNAAKATELNAAGTPDKALSQAENSPYSDVANMVSKTNNDAMAGTMTPDELAQHKQDLSDFSMYQPVKQFMEAGERKEMTGRGAGTLTKTAFDKSMDMFGNRASAVGGIRAGDALQGLSKGIRPSGLGVGGSAIVTRLQSNPQSFGKFAPALQQAQQQGGSQGVAAMHYVLSTTNPEYNQLSQAQQ